MISLSDSPACQEYAAMLLTLFHITYGAMCKVNGKKEKNSSMAATMKDVQDLWSDYQLGQIKKEKGILFTHFHLDYKKRQLEGWCHAS